jgi:hypothetical protein
MVCTARSLDFKFSKLPLLLGRIQATEPAATAVNASLTI